MKIVVGLGNPGAKYQNTRHNAGFLAVDFFLKNKAAISCQSKFNAQICEYQISSNPLESESELIKIFFIKPQSFMNLSGKVVQEICQFYKVDVKKDLLIIHDDKDLLFGQVKVANDSGAAGHNGVQDIIDQLGTQSFNRIRIGVESREPNSPIPTDVFVLQNFTEEELETLNTKTFTETNKLIEKFLSP